MMMNKVDLIVDLQYGSTGKGLLAGYMANTMGHTAAVVCNMPNAGHTFIDGAGAKFVHKVLPNALASPNCNVAFIGPGAVFDPRQMIKEILKLQSENYKVNQIYIHEAAVILKSEHKDWEEDNLRAISSTMQGSAAAMIQKIKRDIDNDPTAGADSEMLHNLGADTGVGIYVMDPRGYLDHLLSHEYILAEGCQGYSLGYNQGFWPYCTSRECTTYRMLSDMSIPAAIPVEVWGSMRTYPIRVGSLPSTTSGGCYPDQAELQWGDINQPPELTTVTGRERRVFTFSHTQVMDAIVENGVDHLFLNFANYTNPTTLGMMVDGVKANTSLDVELYGYGPKITDVRAAE